MRSDPPALRHTLVKACSHDRRAESLIRHRPTLTAGGLMLEIAVRNVILVRIVPRSRRAVDKRRVRGSALRESRRIAITQQISTDCHLQRRLTVAEQVVGGAQPRGDLLPVRKVVHSIELEFRQVLPRWPR